MPPGAEEVAGSSRAKTFPHGLLGRATKRNSIPNAVINPAYNISDSHLQQQATPQAPMSWETPSSTTSASASTPFGQHQGDPSIPDLRAVMFPSDNPFAYPNQPMSALEGTHFMSPEDQQLESFSATTSEQDFGRTNHINTHQMPSNLSFNDLNNSVYGSNLGQQYHNNRHFSAPMGATNFPVSGMEENVVMNGIPGPQEEYWSQINKQGMQTGMTPGVINLDDLFGGDGWNSVWNEQSFSRPE